MKTPDDAIRCVEDFIAAVNERNVKAAQSLSSSGMEMHFPAGIRLVGVAEFFEWIRRRTPVSRYKYDTLHVVQSGADYIVYASGSATGELASGRAFTNVRVLDRFLIRNGKILKKEAWSDMGEVLRQES